jgi:hypothetical protein
MNKIFLGLERYNLTAINFYGLARRGSFHSALGGFSDLAPIRALLHCRLLSFTGVPHIQMSVTMRRNDSTASRPGLANPLVAEQSSEEVIGQVRKTPSRPSWPRSWTNFGLL